MVPRLPAGPEAQALARVDSRGGSDAQGRLAGVRGGRAASLSGGWRRGDAFDRDPADPATTISAYRDGHGRATAVYRRGERLRIDLTGDYLRRDLRGVAGSGSGAVFDRRNLTEIGQGHARLRLRAGRNLASGWLGATRFRDQYVSDQRDSGALDQDQQTRRPSAGAPARAASVPPSRPP